MTAINTQEQEFLRADLAAVTRLLAQLGEEDVLTRIGLESRLEDLRAAVARLDEAEDPAVAPAASVALFFGGRPVIAGRGIESGFGGAVVGKFQDLVAKVMAHREGGLGQRGIVPNKSASTLHIIDVVRGSFGFLIEEVEPQRGLSRGALRSAVDQTTRLLEALGGQDEELFQSAAEAVDQRVLATACEFFELLRQADATVRLVAGTRDRGFGIADVGRAAERATSTAVVENTETIPGRLAGVLPDARQFEFRAADERGIVRGRIASALPADDLARFSRELVDVDAVAKVRVKRVVRRGAVARERFTLLGLEPSDMT